PALAAEMQRLGSPRLSLGGQSQDFTSPAPPASPPPSWEAATTYSLPSSFWAQLRCLLGTTRQPLTAGLNLRSGQFSWTAAMIAGAQQAAGAGVQFSLGNEPDIYYLPNYLSLAKTQLGEEAKAVSLYEQVAAYLRQAIGSQPVIGPELANPAHWRAALPGVISALHPQMLGVHSYPLSVCRSPREATIHGLLAQSVGNAPRRMAWVVADARAAGVPAVISEANSVSCGGKAGVSDSSASAVWAVRFVLAAVETGFGEVSFHLSGNPYDPFYLRGGEVVRRPIEGALVALQQWMAPGATLRVGHAVGDVALAAVAAPAGEPLLLLDNESTKPATLSLRGAASAAPVQVFSPAGAGSGRGTVTPAGTGRFLVKVPANGVLALHFAPSRRAPPSGRALDRSPERRLDGGVDRHRTGQAHDL